MKIFLISPVKRKEVNFVKRIFIQLGIILPFLKGVPEGGGISLPFLKGVPVGGGIFRDKVEEEQKRIREYVASLEAAGYKVHLPIRDTKQDDPTGGYEICRTNFQAIKDVDEIHIWYKESSHGSKFDMGGAFMLIVIQGIAKKVVIVNEGEVIDNTKKSFYKVFQHIIREQN